MRTTARFVLSLAMATSLCEAGPSFPAEQPATHDVVLENRVPIAMRDGVVLYADVYRPRGAGRFPVIVGRSPYGIEREATPVYQYPAAWEAPLFFAERGYVFVYQDIRGRYESEGTWEPFRNDIADGYDTIEWAAQQPWSSGRVGMYGVSYEGTVQWRAAMAAPPHLVTIVPSVAATSVYHHWVTSNGAWRLAFNLEWGAIRMESRVTQSSIPHRLPGSPPGLSLPNLLRQLPIGDQPALAGRRPAFFRDWLAHPEYDDYWKAIDASESFGRIGIPVLNIGGWFDLFRDGTLDGFVGLRKSGATAVARQRTQLLMGPWGHWPSRRVGDLDFGEAAFIDQRAVALEWFDHWLKGIDNGVGSRAPARVFVMGVNEWRELEDFPPPRTRACRLYLTTQGGLSWQRSSRRAKAREYQYNPADPAPSVAFGSDQRRLDVRPDVLAYTSAVLTEDLEVIGPLRLELSVSSSAPDTDFVARLGDVHPDGPVIALAEGIRRARHREGTDRAAYLRPGQVYRLDIDMAGTAHVFRKGHRIQVHVTSSAFPAFDRHLNGVHPFASGAESVIATQSIHGSRQHPSRLLLPVTTASAGSVIQAECEEIHR